jgi:pimeloyl-ACP methyl ester carboxylesterase
MTSTIMFVHGAWLTPSCWKPWRRAFEALGYATHAPTWPFMDRPMHALRGSPDPRLAKVGVSAIVDHYAGAIEALPERPIIIGHSFGGLVTQMLMGRGLGAAGVAIDPAPPRGVLPGPRSVLSALPVLTSWNGWNRVLRMSRAGFERDFANALPPAMQGSAFDHEIVPAPGRPYFQAALGIGNRVDFKAIAGPMLFVSGGRDRTAEPSMVRAIWHRYRKAGISADLAVYPDGSHFLIAEPGWERIVEGVATWLRHEDLAPAPETATPADALVPA